MGEQRPERATRAQVSHYTRRLCEFGLWNTNRGSPNTCRLCVGKSDGPPGGISSEGTSWRSPPCAISPACLPNRITSRKMMMMMMMMRRRSSHSHRATRISVMQTRVYTQPFYCVMRCCGALLCAVLCLAHGMSMSCQLRHAMPCYIMRHKGHTLAQHIYNRDTPCRVVLIHAKQCGLNSHVPRCNQLPPPSVLHFRLPEACRLCQTIVANIAVMSGTPYGATFSHTPSISDAAM